jgi:Tol biopolymer transport system component
LPVFASGDPDKKSNMTEKPALLDTLKAMDSKIVYETYQNNNWDLFTVNANGSNPVNLTNTPTEHEMYAHVSPNGKMICFTVDAETENGKVRCVYRMNIDGTGRQLVSRKARQACWSPDSKTIAFLKSKYDKFQLNDYATKGIFFYDVATGKVRAHPANDKIHHLYNICWSSNDKWMVATVHAGMGHSHTTLAIQVDGKKIVNLKTGGCRPDLSPDGKQMVWGRTDYVIGLADIDLDGPEPSLSNIRDFIVETVHIYHVEWSPDGKYLCYSRGPGGRVLARGPGTSAGHSEIVGVSGRWDLCITPVEGERIYATITNGKGTQKEADWYR